MHKFSLEHVFTYLIFAGGLLLSATVSANSTSGQDAFQAGVKASQDKRYEEAVKHFLDAKKQGRDSAALHHNLGVAYFKLGQYEKANEAFKQASRSDKMAALSYYNLGLVAEKQGRPDEARQWFEKARDQARTTQLQRLAERKLGIRQTVAVPYVAYLEAFVGNDSNPQLVDDPSNLNIERDSDAFYGGLAYGRYHFGGDSRRGFYLVGSAYSRNYLDVDEENTSVYSAGGGFKHRVGAWQQDYQLAVNRLSLDGDEVQTSIIGALDARKRLAGNRLFEARLLGESIDGDRANGYDYLTGERARLRLRYRNIASPVTWKLTYEATFNDRDELVTLDAGGNVDNVFDVSPLRHEVAADLEWPLLGSLKGTLRGNYRISQYRDEEVRGGVEAGERDDDLWAVRAGLLYPFGRGFNTRLEATYTENDSNFDRFDYDRTEVVLSVGYSFN